MDDIENTEEGIEQGEAQGESQVDVEARIREIEERQRELDKRERDLNKGFMEISARERELSEKPVYMQDEEDDDLPPLAPEAEKLLDKYIERKIAPIVQSQQALYAETIDAELKEVSSSTGVPQEDIIDIINTTGLAPKDESIKAARDVIKAAAEIAKAKSFDESAVEKRIREKILKELAEQGTSIEGVAPLRDVPNMTDIDESEMTPAQRYQYLKSKQAS